MLYFFIKLMGNCPMEISVKIASMACPKTGLTQYPMDPMDMTL